MNAMIRFQNRSNKKEDGNKTIMDVTRNKNITKVKRYVICLK
jgi:hypothetical protein